MTPQAAALATVLPAVRTPKGALVLDRITLDDLAAGCATRARREAREGAIHIDGYMSVEDRGMIAACGVAVEEAGLDLWDLSHRQISRLLWAYVAAFAAEREGMFT